MRIGQVISAFVTLSAALIIAFTFGWKLAIVLVLGVPIIAGAAYKQLMLVQRSQKRDSECMDEAGRVRKLTRFNPNAEYDITTLFRVYHLITTNTDVI